MADETTTTEMPENPSDVLVILAKDSSSGAIAAWSDDKKKDYVKLFKKRAAASMYILRNSAYTLATKARDKQFLGQPRYNKLVEDCNRFAGDDVVRSRGNYYDRDYNEGEAWRETYDRSKTDLDSIVTERVNALLRNLPSLNAAMAILDPDTLKRIERRDQLKEMGQELTEKFEELSTDIRMKELPRTMTIGDFLDKVEALEKERKDLLEQLQKIGEEGQDHERAINKALFKGLPGIGEEIESVVKELYQQSRDLGVTCRDVENVVLYGDNEAALKILEAFKADERKIATEIGQRFQKGLELLKLKLNGRRKKKEEAGAPETPPAALPPTE
jgi:hypothetical protein